MHTKKQNKTANTSEKEIPTSKHRIVCILLAMERCFCGNFAILCGDETTFASIGNYVCGESHAANFQAERKLHAQHTKVYTLQNGAKTHLGI